MPLTNKAELLAALSDNALDIEQTAARISGRISDEQWQQELCRIAELRKAQKELQVKLAALIE
jgi:hypothetical protein